MESSYTPSLQYLKIYRSHNCDGSHRYYRTAAQCIWPWAASVSGEGPYVIRHKGADWIIELHEPSTIVGAVQHMKDAHHGGPCSGTCKNYYDLYFLEPTVLEAGYRLAAR